jgi:hypothetical protein
MLKRTKIVKQNLLLAMISEVQPHLQSLGFKFVGKPSKGRFKRLWIRDRGIELDGIVFDWDKYGDPKFFIRFRSFDHPDDLVKCRSNISEINAKDFAATAYGKPRSIQWFKPNFILTMLGFETSEIERLIKKTNETLTGISEFFLGGPAMDNMQDSSLWLSSRLPDNPPPWNDSYHLPPRRVGAGQKLTNWE